MYSIPAKIIKERKKVKPTTETHIKHTTKNETDMRGRTLDARPALRTGAVGLKSFLLAQLSLHIQSPNLSTTNTEHRNVILHMYYIFISVSVV